MRRHGNLWPLITDAANIEAAWRKAKRGKAGLKGVNAFNVDTERKLAAIRQSLLERTFHTGAYTQHVIHEPKTRTIYALPFAPDRIVQHAAMNVLGPLWSSMFIAETFACIEGRGAHRASKLCMEYTRRYRYCLQCDVAQFYPSIHHDMLKRIFRKKIKCRDTLWLLDDFVDSYPGPTNAPIGNLSSQWFGNLYLAELDAFAKSMLNIPAYVRYCDDFLVFGDDKGQLRQWRDDLASFCGYALKLSLKKAEIFPTSAGVQFVGYRHFPSGYLLLRKKTAKRLRRTVEAGAGREPEYRRSMLASVHGWIKHANSHNLAVSLRLDEQRAALAA